MISVRGPECILVVDRTAVPVLAVCDAAIKSKTLDEITSKLPVTEQELFAAIDAFVAVTTLGDNDYIKFHCNKDDEDVSVDTVSVTDTIYLNALVFGREQRPNEQNLYALYAYGIESIMFDCLLDISNGDRYYMSSSLHSKVYESFCKAFGRPSHDEVKDLLNSLIDEGITK